MYPTKEEIKLRHLKKNLEELRVEKRFLSKKYKLAHKLLDKEIEVVKGEVDKCKELVRGVHNRYLLDAFF